MAHQGMGNAEAAFIYAGKALAQVEELTDAQQVMLYMLQAVWYEGRGELETAVTAAAAAAALDDTITLYGALQAWQAYRAFDMETAVTAAETVLAATTADDLSTQIAQRTLGAVATLQDNPRPALAALDAALAIHPNDIEARALRVHNLAVVSEWDAAREDTVFLVELAPTAPASLWAQAIVARLDSDRALAQVLINQAIAQDTTHPEYYWFRAVSYRTTMDQDKEANDLTAALVLYPEFLWALEAQQHLLLDQYNNEHLEEAAYQLIEMYPHSPAGYQLLTVYYLDVEGDNEAALQQAEEAVARNPDAQRGYELRGYVYLQLNDLEAAQVDYERMLTLDPDSSGARFGLASIARREENWETAVTLTQEVVELYPGSLSAKIDLASAYLDQNDLEKAWQLVHQVLAEDPRDVKATLLRAYLYSFQGEHEQALSEVEKTLSLFPNNAFAHVTKASFLIDLGQLDEAADSAEDAIALDALLTDPHRLLFFVALENEDFEEAETQLDLWLEKATPYDDNPELLSYMQLVTGRYEDAIDTTTAALVEASEADGLYYNRALAYLNLEQAEAGQADMEQILSVSQNLDLIVDAEEVLVDSRQVVRVGDGRLQFSNETFGYTVNYADWWDMAPADEEQNIDLFLLYETDDDFGAAYTILFVEQDEVTAELIAGYVLEASSQRSDFTLISAEPAALNEGESYVIRYELAGSELFQGKQYIFTKGNRIVLLTLEAYDLSFVEMEAEIDAIAASFVFLP
jgi:FimV-like protein